MHRLASLFFLLLLALLAGGCPSNDRDPAAEDSANDRSADSSAEVSTGETTGEEPDVATEMSPASEDAGVEPEVGGEKIDCAPDCAGRECGEDGCGGSCGQCSGPTEQCEDGQCACKPDCGEAECGDDGCGGSCGQCHEFAECVAGQCLCASECFPVGSTSCQDGDVWICSEVATKPVCNDLVFSEPCADGKSCVGGKCVASCDSQSCAGCCLEDGTCLPGSQPMACGTGGDACTACPVDFECVGGSCQAVLCGPANCSGCCDADGLCQPGEANALCGSGGSACVSCEAGKSCQAGSCAACLPDCVGKECGEDGCGGTCGQCGQDFECHLNLCAPAYCTPRSAVFLFQGLAAENGGLATWNTDGSGPEPEGNGHAVTWTPLCPPASAHYYAATIDHVMPATGQGLEGFFLIDGFKLLNKVLEDNALSAADITITQTLMDLGNDTNAQDWWYDPATTNESRYYQGSVIHIRLQGEEMITANPGKTVLLHSYKLLGNCLDDGVSGETDYALPQDASQQSSPVAQAAAEAFIADVGAFGFSVFFGGMTPAGQLPAQGDGRTGTLYQVMQGALQIGVEPIGDCQ